MDAITFPAECTLLCFLGWGEQVCFHCLLYIFYSGSKWWTYASSWVTTSSIKSRDHLQSETGEISSRVLFWSWVNIRGTYLAEAFDIPKMSIRIYCTVPKPTPTSLAMLHRSRLMSWQACASVHSALSAQMRKVVCRVHRYADLSAPLLLKCNKYGLLARTPKTLQPHSMILKVV